MILFSFKLYAFINKILVAFIFSEIYVIVVVKMEIDEVLCDVRVINLSTKSVIYVWGYNQSGQTARKGKDCHWRTPMSIPSKLFKGSGGGEPAMVGYCMQPRTHCSCSLVSYANICLKFEFSVTLVILNTV